jgi:hypothetical protein
MTLLREWTLHIRKLILLTALLRICFRLSCALAAVPAATSENIVSVPIDLRDPYGNNSVVTLQLKCSELMASNAWEMVRVFCEENRVGYSCDWLMRHVINLRENAPECLSYKNTDVATAEQEIIDNNIEGKLESDSVKFESIGFMGPFATIFRTAGSDKVGQHGFQRFYPRFIDPYRSITGGAMLEIGIDRNFSLKAWLEYLPNAYIYGVDIGFEFEGERHRVFRADQGNEQQMRGVMSMIRHPVFIILDDGSHDPGHQIQCFDYLFRELLVPGGTYIIEDIETSYWRKGAAYGTGTGNDSSSIEETGYGWRNERSAIEVFKALADDINREYLPSDIRAKQDDAMTPFLSLEVSAEYMFIVATRNALRLIL